MMKILVYGIGGVGGYFGGKLAQTNHHVTFIARGAHLEAIRKEGLHVKSYYGDFVAQPNLATDNPLEAPQPDLVILAVKSWQLADVAKQLHPILGENTLVLPLQNGANNVDILRNSLDTNQLLAGLCRIISFIAAPGKIHHKAFHPQVLFGELNNTNTPRVQAIKQVFDTAGFDSKIPENIQLEIWRKFIFICTISGIGALTRSEIGRIRSDTYLRKLMLRTANEIAAIANAKNIPLAKIDIDNTFKAIDKQAPNTTASMQRDIMEGKPSELDNFNGYIVREGKKYNIPTPVNEYIYHCLLPLERNARG